MPGMAMHPLAVPGAAALPDGHEIRVVTDAAGLADHADVLADGFGMPHEWATAFATETMLRVPAATFYVGYENGAAVTSGLGVRVGRTIGVYNIATVEPSRRRGLGAAMTMRVVDDGAAAGCDVAILQASEMGRPTYERLGFRTVCEYFGYVEPGAEG
jgi:GNAT superfamily N-acetyltransferase